jgi:inorganic phosphate transporter, PiT family
VIYFVLRRTVRDKRIYEPAKDHPPVWWMRGVLIATCTGVSFAHGTNDGQKSIGLIMLTIVGLLPAIFALNPNAGQALADLPKNARAAAPFIEKYGDDRKDAAIAAVNSLEKYQAETPEKPTIRGFLGLGHGQDGRLGESSESAKQRATVRNEVYEVIAQLKHAEDMKGISDSDKKEVKALTKRLGQPVEYAPWWVRILSALCLGVGTMIGYKRIVTTLGARLGKTHMTPAQGASAETVSAALISFSGFSGFPVSTTHIVTSGIAGTMVAAGSALQWDVLRRILIAWLVTLPVTILIAAGLYYLFESPAASVAR